MAAVPVKITDLTPGVALDGTEKFEAVQSAASVSLTATQIKTFTKTAGYTYNAPITGFALTIAAGIQYLVLEPAGTLATGAVTMPASPPDGTVVRISSTQIITALTLTPNSGQTIVGSATTLAAAISIGYLYRSANTSWYRVG